VLGSRVIPGTLFKQPTVPKLQKLKDAAKNYPCAHCGRDDGTVVASHCNELALGRGFAHKTPDYLVAFLCMECHDYCDGRRGAMTRDEKRALWNRAFVQTQAWLWRDGRIIVA
jgi:putative nuclease YbcO-like protein